jgi:hypothetical protein
MTDAVVRPRWRDALALAVLAAVLIGGLVHYGQGLGRHEPTAKAPQHPSSTAGPPSPTGGATAQLDGAPPTDPAAPADPAGGSCWDGRATSSLKLCGLPGGARGLAWVFPSFERDRGLCHQAAPNDDSYPVTESYECFQQALGQPVTITYDEVEDPAVVEQWLVARIGAQHRHLVPGAHGGRAVFQDAASRPARITGTYTRFPYVVSVYAASPRAALRAWRTLVDQRPPQRIRGVRNS